MAYAQAIKALPEFPDATTARVASDLVSRVVAILAEARNPHACFGLADIIAVLGGAMPTNAWLLAATECLKHPFCAGANALVGALARHCGFQEDRSQNFWAVVRWLETHEAWLPLRQPLS
jgi:hypothetical protein